MTAAYEAVERRRRAATDLVPGHGAADPKAAAALKRALADTRNALADDGKPLVHLRVDADGETHCVGKVAVRDDDGTLLVVPWHAPQAMAWEGATPEECAGLDLRRRLVCRDRQVLRLIDDIVSTGRRAASGSGPTADAVGLLHDRLLEELERARGGAMRDIVETIQREQRAVIRSLHPGVLLVQGGPGTGKTAVGLHRVVHLLANTSGLDADSVLVVGPNSTFLRYVEDVLPALDAGGVRHRSVTQLCPGPVRGEDGPLAARVKGSAAMATLLRRALQAQVGPARRPVAYRAGTVTFEVPVEQTGALVNRLRDRDLPYDAARDVLREQLADALFERYREACRAAGRPFDGEVRGRLKQTSRFTTAIDAMWQCFSAEELLRRLYGTRSWLEPAAEGLLDAGERDALLRRPAASVADEPWTAADRVCLDEVEHLLSGEVPGTLGHVVVDEAQDLTVMQARVLARRCPSRSMTVLGDLAQATGPQGLTSWAPLLQALVGRAGHEVAALTVGYRVPEEVTAVTAPLAAALSPDLPPPGAVRAVPGAVTVRRTSPGRLLDDALDVAVAQAHEDGHEGRSTVVVVPDSWLGTARTAAVTRHLPDSVLDLAAIGDALTVLPAQLTKGLEFDHVVVVEPAEIAAQSPSGLQELYVALTRCTQSLRVLHAAELPEPLAPAADADPAAAPGTVEEQVPVPAPPSVPRRPSPLPSAVDGAVPSVAVAELVDVAERLCADDLTLLLTLARRLGGSEE